MAVVAPYIIEPIRSLAVDIGTLTPDPNNAVTHDTHNVEIVKRSMTEFGQDVPLVVQRRGEELIVRKGNCRLQAAIELGWDYIAVIVVDEDDTQAIARALMDNRSSDFHTWDDNKVQELLAQIADDFTPDAMGWGEEDMAALVTEPPVELPNENESHAPADNVLKRITFTTTAEQSTIIHDAVECLRQSEQDSTITMSRAIELICAEFLSAHAADVAAQNA